MTQVANAEQVARAKPAEPEVPSKIAVPAGNKLFLVGHAKGVQIYTCNGTGTGWGPATPDAKLFDDKGKFVADHFAGPTWQYKGSKVVATRVDGVTVDTTAIPWLLLKATSTTPGQFGNTTFIQRVKTAGGLAPTTPCTPGEVKPVDYTADYYFWKATGKP
jgi:hypothetical protein